jgi:hypothetical protein
MKYATGILWALLLVSIVAIASIVPTKPITESFDSPVAGISLMDMSNAALDATPSTSEVKLHYKNLLLFANADIQKQGTQGLRILADLRDRLFGPTNFRDNLIVPDFIGNWPDWMPPLDPDIEEPIPSITDAVTAEVRILAYLQSNFPQEPNVDEQTGSTIRNLIEDIGYRFVFKQGVEAVALRPDFLSEPLLKDWRNPTN